jgi:predicted RND superfamily exporter protein
MSDYEIALIWGAVLLIASLLSGFEAVTNHRSVVVAMVLFVIGGFALYYAQSLNPEGALAADLPKAIYKLYGRVVN